MGLIRRIRGEFEALDATFITYHATGKDWRVSLFIPFIRVFLYLRRRRSGHYPFLNRWVLRAWRDADHSLNIRPFYDDGDELDKRKYK